MVGHLWDSQMTRLPVRLKQLLFSFEDCVKISSSLGVTRELLGDLLDSTNLSLDPQERAVCQQRCAVIRRWVDSVSSSGGFYFVITDAGWSQLLWLLGFYCKQPQPREGVITDVARRFLDGDTITLEMIADYSKAEPTNPPALRLGVCATTMLTCELPEMEILGWVEDLTTSTKACLDMRSIVSCRFPD